jgi:hypothetical protein
MVGPATAALNSEISASMLGWRAPGSFAMARWITASRAGGNSGRTERTDGGGACRCLTSTSPKLSPEKGGCPVNM